MRGERTYYVAECLPDYCGPSRLTRERAIEDLVVAGRADSPYGQVIAFYSSGTYRAHAVVYPTYGESTTSA